MKMIFAALLIISSSTVFAQTIPQDAFIHLNQCQRKALKAVQIKANKKFDTYVTLKKMTQKKTPNVLDEKTYIVDVDKGSIDSDSSFARYEAVVLSTRTGSCAGNDAAQARFIK